MDEKQIRTKISEGHIHIRAIVEVVGTPKEYVEQTLKDYIKKLEQEKKYILVKKTFHKAEKGDDELFVSFFELDLLVKDSMALLSFCFDFMPASVEIVDPGRLSFNSFDFTGFLNDMQARLHAVNIGISNYKTRNEHLITNTATLMKNFVRYLVKEPKTLQEISHVTGIREEEVQKLLDALASENYVVKKGSRYQTR